MATRLNTVLESPGVDIRERDISQTATIAAGTNVFLAGFAESGPTDEPIQVSSINEFEEIFGLPETPAAKYAYNAAKQVLTTSNGSLTFTRMPYGSGAGLGYSDQYSALVFPLVGVSAVEVNACEYFRQIDEDTCRVEFPWLYTAYFTKSAICYGSSNLECPLDSQEDPGGNLVIHNHPFEYNSVMTGFKFVVDADSSPEDIKLFQLRPTVNGFDTTYTVVTSFSLSSVYANMDEDQSHLSNDSKRLIVNLESTPFAKTLTPQAGLMSGITLSGVFVSAGDVFGTWSNAGAGALKYYFANQDVAGSYRSSVSSLSGFGVGSSVTYVTTAVDSTELDYLISFCATPVEAGISCSTVTALGLQVPEEDRYNFYPLLGDAQLNDANFYVLGAPISKTLNATEYSLLMNEQFNWKCGVYANAEAGLDVVNNDIRAGLIIVNEMKTAQLDDFTGYYVAVNDNLNINPNTDYDNLTGVNAFYNEVCPGVSGNWIPLPEERMNFNVSQTFDGTAGSISEVVEQNAGWDFGRAFYNDSLIVSLFKLRPNRLTETINKLDQTLIEKYVGSLAKSRKVADEFGGPPRSYFIEDTVNNSSNYMKVIVNPYLSQNNCWLDNQSGNPQKTVRMFRQRTGGVFHNFDAQAKLSEYGDNLYGFGNYTGHCQDLNFTRCQQKDIGNLPAKLERALRNVENPLQFPIDITVDAGLSTIWATRQSVQADNCITDPSICYYYDDTYFVNTDSLSPFDNTVMNSSLQDAWEVVYNIFDSFARFTRKANGGVGHFHIQDPLRQIFVNGRDFKIENRQKQYVLDPTTNQPTDKYANFSRNIWTYLRNLYSGVNSSYTSSYANWIKDYDVNTDSYCWFGPSGHVAALLARNDRDQFPWTAPFGISGGALPNIVDLAINPNQRERDLLSRIGLNPIVRFPEGNVIWNSLTLLKEESALKENYIRRGLLWLEKSAQATLRQFIGKPNTPVTRTRVVNTLKPILQFMKDNAGLYDYEIVCDTRNNTPETIDQYTLNVAIYVKPTRTIKFILAEVVVTRTGVSFESVI